MIARALLVPRSRGEEARRALLAAGLLRTDLVIRREGAILALPLVEGGAAPPGWGEVAERAFELHPGRPPADYRALLSWPEEEKTLLPRSFDVVGDVVLVRLPPKLEARRTEIGEALLRFVPGVRIVGWDRGVHGPERRRAIERIAGNGGWETWHRENGLELAVDLERAYFSPRLAGEHARVAEAIRPGERVYDLCCGVGPFSLAIARGGRTGTVVAVDANPAAIALMKRSLGRVAFGGTVRPIEARIESFLESAEPFEVVVFNLPREGIKYASSVARAVASGGRLFYYEVVPRAESEGRASVIERSLAPQQRFRTLERHVVHPYSPAADLMAFEFQRGTA